MMSYEDYQRIWEDFCSKETIQTPVGLMVGKPAPPGSKIPFSDYTMTLEDGPFKGETVTITGLGGGHGTLFFNTEKGKTAVKVEYDQPKVEYEDDEEDLSNDVPSEDDEDEDAGQEQASQDVPKLRISGDGFRTTLLKAERAVEWFNGGRPKTKVIPVTVMKGEKVCDAERIPLTAGKTVWRSLELKVVCFGDSWNDVGGTASVWLGYDSEYDNGGLHSPLITNVTSVKIDGDILTISGFDFGSEAERSDWRSVTVTVGIIEEAEASGRVATKWYLEEMIAPIQVDDWLNPTNTLSTPCQSGRVLRQFSLEEFS